MVDVDTLKAQIPTADGLIRFEARSSHRRRVLTVHPTTIQSFGIGDPNFRELEPDPRMAVAGDVYGGQGAFPAIGLLSCRAHRDRG